MTQKHTNNKIQETLNNFGVKHGNQENIKKAECVSNMAKELEGLEEGPKAEIQFY